MTNREHILKVIAGLDDNTLCDIFIELPDEVRNKEPICGPCDFCPHDDNGDCDTDFMKCAERCLQWMNAEVRPR